TILMLLSPRAMPGAILFLAGWVVGVATAVTVFTVIADYLPRSEPGAPNPVASILRIALGVALLVLAVLKFRQQLRSPKDAALPGWMSSLSAASPRRSLVLGLALGGVNPKNLLISVAAGLSIGTASLTVGAQVAGIAVYTLLASITVIVPVVVFLLAGERMRGPLTSLNDWLERNNSVILAVLFLVFGVLLVGNGLTGFE
ncbi:MAG: hypothetical protein JWN36_1891, partial [Microbacteriaceae bacterium]|nr:hypothetical protein [Microbacteriaceae bacterium]